MKKLIILFVVAMALNAFDCCRLPKQYKYDIFDINNESRYCADSLQFMKNGDMIKAYDPTTFDTLYISKPYRIVKNY